MFPILHPTNIRTQPNSAFEPEGWAWGIMKKPNSIHSTIFVILTVLVISKVNAATDQKNMSAMGGLRHLEEANAMRHPS